MTNAPNHWHLETVSSTQEAMRDWLTDDARSPGDVGVLTANTQTDGLGRDGRPWEQGPGTSLLCSVGVVGPMSADLVGNLPLRIARGVAVELNALASEERIAVKHPNDLVVDGRKVAGVLADAHHVGPKVEWVCIGIGVNLAGPEFVAGDRAATTVEAVLGVVPDAETLARQVAAVVCEELDVPAPRWS